MAACTWATNCIFSGDLCPGLAEGDDGARQVVEEACLQSCSEDMSVSDALCGFLACDDVIGFFTEQDMSFADSCIGQGQMDVSCEDTCMHVSMCGQDGDVPSYDDCMAGCRGDGTDEQRQCILDIPCEGMTGDDVSACLDNAGNQAPTCQDVCSHFEDCGAIDSEEALDNCLLDCNDAFDDDVRICISALDCEEVQGDAVEMCANP